MHPLCKDTNAGGSTKLTLCAHLVRLLHLNSFRCPALSVRVALAMFRAPKRRGQHRSEILFWVSAADLQPKGPGFKPLLFSFPATYPYHVHMPMPVYCRRESYSDEIYVKFFRAVPPAGPGRSWARIPPAPRAARRRSSTTRLCAHARCGIPLDAARRGPRASQSGSSGGFREPIAKPGRL